MVLAAEAVRRHEQEMRTVNENQKSGHPDRINVGRELKYNIGH